MKNAKSKKRKDLTEVDLKNVEVPWYDKLSDVTWEIGQIMKMKHDYDSLVHGVARACVVVMHYFSGKLGMSGFQASCVDLEIIRRTRGWDNFKILNYDDMLFPQHGYKYEKTMSRGTFEGLQKEAQKKLDKFPSASSDCINHWKKVIDGEVPFGYTLED